MKKLIYLALLLVIISCGKNLAGEEYDTERPSALNYSPDSLSFDINMDSVLVTVRPSIDRGSGDVEFEITFPIIEGLTINRKPV